MGRLLLHCEPLSRSDFKFLRATTVLPASCRISVLRTFLSHLPRRLRGEFSVPTLFFLSPISFFSTITDPILTLSFILRPPTVSVCLHCLTPCFKSFSGLRPINAAEFALQEEISYSSHPSLPCHFCVRGVSTQCTAAFLIVSVTSRKPAHGRTVVPSVREIALQRPTRTTWTAFSKSRNSWIVFFCPHGRKTFTQNMVQTGTSSIVPAYHRRNLRARHDYLPLLT